MPPLPVAGLVKCGAPEGYFGQLLQLEGGMRWGGGGMGVLQPWRRVPPLLHSAAGCTPRWAPLGLPWSFWGTFHQARKVWRTQVGLVSCLAVSREGGDPFHSQGSVSNRMRTRGFDTINESARRPRGKGSFIPQRRGQGGACHQGTGLHGNVGREGAFRPSRSSGTAQVLLLAGGAAMAQTAARGRPWRPPDPSEAGVGGW